MTNFMSLALVESKDEYLSFIQGSLDENVYKYRAGVTCHQQTTSLYIYACVGM